MSNVGVTLEDINSLKTVKILFYRSRSPWSPKDHCSKFYKLSRFAPVVTAVCTTWMKMSTEHWLRDVDNAN